MATRFLVICLLILSFPTPLSALTIDEIKIGVVKISAHVDGKTKIGTGFIVNLKPGVAYIVTASHVVEGADELYVAFFTQPHNLFMAKNIGLEGGDPRGLAALQVVGLIPSSVGALNFNRSVTVREGEIVKTVGFPQMGAIPWAVTSGTILGWQGRYIVFSGAVDEGNSGGPLIKNGAVVGVITENQGKYNYAQPVNTVESALEGWRVGFLDETDELLVQDALDRFAREHGILVEVTGGQFATLLYFLKHKGEYWGQIYLGLAAVGRIGLIPRNTDESIERVYLLLDAAAQVWAGKNLSDSIRNMTPSDALKEFGNIIKRERIPLEDDSVPRVRQKVLKNKEIFIRDEFARGGPKLRQLK